MAINLIIAYILTYIGIVPRVAGMTPMSGMPIILSGFMEGSWKIAAITNCTFSFIYISLVSIL